MYEGAIGRASAREPDDYFRICFGNPAGFPSGLFGFSLQRNPRVNRSTKSPRWHTPLDQAILLSSC